MTKLARILTVVWMLLSFGDASVTYFALKHPGLVEGNPIARWLLFRGQASFYGFKVAATVLVGAGMLWVISKLPNRYMGWVVGILALLVLIYAGILVNNLIRI